MMSIVFLVRLCCINYDYMFGTIWEDFQLNKFSRKYLGFDERWV